MEARMDPVVLSARAFLLAAMAVFLGVAGHVTADGQLPGPAVLVLLVAATYAGCLGMLRHPAGPVRIVVLLVGGQAAIHLVLTVTAGHVGEAVSRMTGPVSPTASSLPISDGRRVGSMLDSYAATEAHRELAPTLPVGHLVSGVSAHAPLVLAHLLAAVAIGLWLAVGETCLWVLLGLLASLAVRLLLPVVALVVTVPARRPHVALVRRVPPPLLLLARAVTRRGPPVLLTA